MHPCAQIHQLINYTMVYFAASYILGKHGQKDCSKIFCHMQEKIPEETDKIKVSKTLKFWLVCICIEREGAIMV